MISKLTSKDLPKVQYVDLANGERYAYRVYGEGPKTLMFMTGYAGDSLLDGLILRHFDLKEFTILDPEVRGSGESSYNQEISHLTDLADDYKLFLDALKVTKLHGIVGLSMGGAIAPLFAGKYPEVTDKLVLLIPAPLNLSKFPLDPDMVRTPNRKYIADWLDSDIYEQAEKRLFNFRSRESLLDQLSKGLDCFEEYKKVKAKVLVGQAEKDELFPISVGESIVEGIGKDNATLAILEDCTHSIRTDKAPYVVGVASKFLLQ